MDRRWMFAFGRPFPWLLGLFLLVRWIMAEQCSDGCIKCEGSKCITCSNFLVVDDNKCIVTCKNEYVEVTNDGKQCRTVNTAASTDNHHAVLIGVCSGGAVLFLVIVTGIMYFRRSRDKDLQSSLIEAAQRRKSTQDYSHMNGGFEPDSFGPSEYRSRIFSLKSEIPTFVAMLNEVKKKAQENPVSHGNSCPYRTTFTELTRFVLLLKSNILNVSVMADSKQTLEWAENALLRYKETQKGNKDEVHDEKRAESVPSIVVTEPEKLSIEIERVDEEESEAQSVIEQWTDKDQTINQNNVSSAFDDLQLVSSIPQIPDVDYETVSVAESQTKEEETQLDVKENSSEHDSKKVDHLQLIPEPDYNSLEGVSLASSVEEQTYDEVLGHPHDLMKSNEFATLDPVDEATELQIGKMTSDDKEAITDEVKSMVSPNTETQNLADTILPSADQLQVSETLKFDKVSIIPKPPPQDKSLEDVIAKMAAKALTSEEISDSRASSPNMSDSRVSTPKMSDSREGTPKTKSKLMGLNRQMGFKVSATTLMNAREGLRSVKDNNDREILSKSPDNRENRRQQKPTTATIEPPVPSISHTDLEPDLVNEKTEIPKYKTNQEEDASSKTKNDKSLPLISETQAVNEDEDDFTSL